MISSDLSTAFVDHFIKEALTVEEMAMPCFFKHKLLIMANCHINISDYLRLRNLFNDLDDFVAFLYCASFVKNIDAQVIDGIEVIKIEFYTHLTYSVEIKNEALKDAIVNKSGYKANTLIKCLNNLRFEEFYSFIIKFGNFIKINEFINDFSVNIEIEPVQKDFGVTLRQISFVDDEGKVFEKVNQVQLGDPLLLQENSKEKITQKFGEILERIRNESLLKGKMPFTVLGYCLVPNSDIADLIQPTNSLYVYCNHLQNYSVKHVTFVLENERLTFNFNGKLSNAVSWATNEEIHVLYLTLKESIEEETEPFHVDLEIHANKKDFERLKRALNIKEDIPVKCENTLIHKFCYFAETFDEMFEQNRLAFVSGISRKGNESLFFYLVRDFNNSVRSVKVYINQETKRGYIISPWLNLKDSVSNKEFEYSISDWEQNVGSFQTLNAVKRVLCQQVPFGINSTFSACENNAMIFVCNGLPLLDESLNVNTGGGLSCFFNYSISENHYNFDKLISRHLSVSFKPTTIIEKLFQILILGKTVTGIYSPQPLQESLNLKCTATRTLTTNDSVTSYSAGFVFDKSSSRWDSLQAIASGEINNMIEKFGLFQLDYSKFFLVSKMRDCLLLNTPKANTRRVRFATSYLECNRQKANITSLWLLKAGLKIRGFRIRRNFKFSEKIRGFKVYASVSSPFFGFDLGRNFEFLTSFNICAVLGTIPEINRFSTRSAIGLNLLNRASKIFKNRVFVRVTTASSFGLPTESNGLYLTKTINPNKTRYFAFIGSSCQNFGFISSKSILGAFKPESFLKRKLISRNILNSVQIYEMFPFFTFEMQLDVGASFKDFSFSLGTNFEMLLFNLRELPTLRLKRKEEIMTKVIITPFLGFNFNISMFAFKGIVGYNLDSSGHINFNNLVLRLYL